MVTRQDVIDAYTLFSGQPPESEDLIQTKLTNWTTTTKMIRNLSRSKKINTKECQARLKSTRLTEELVELGYKVLLRRLPESQEVIEHKMANVKSQWHLIQELMKSDEYVQKNDLKHFVKYPEFNENPKIIYLHIPKTAGKSFEQLAIKNYGEECSLSTIGRFPWEVWQSARLVGGHYVYTTYNGMTTQRLFVSLVRDPVERAISRFNFYRSMEKSRQNRARRGFDHDDMKGTLRKSTFRIEFMNNYQCYYLSGKHNFGAVRESFENDAFIVGHFDQIDEWLTVLGDRLGWTERELPRVNTAADPSYMDEYKKDKKLLSILEKGNRDDYSLLEFIQKHGVYESGGPDFDYSVFRKPMLEKTENSA